MLLPKANVPYLIHKCIYVVVAPLHCRPPAKVTLRHGSESNRRIGRGMHLLPPDAAAGVELTRLAAATCARGFLRRWPGDVFHRLLAGNREQHLALALDAFLAALRLRLFLAGGLLGADALAQGIHEVDDFGGLAALRRLDLDTFGFLLDQIAERRFVVILE